MALNFPTNPSDGDTYQGFVYNSTKSAWKAVTSTIPTDIGDLTDTGSLLGSAVTVYTNSTDLPLTGNTTGDQAFVSGNNRLYLWTGSGWYNIALINNAPSITSGGAGAYTLAIDGTPTVITLTANDPEGIPLTWAYSVTSGSLGSTATVSQADNVFTITPSTNEAHAGTFSLTFTASDGVNTATDTNTFTLAFQVENSKYTSALITSVGSNTGTNSTVTDSSSNNHTVTVNGNISSQTFSPYRSGGYSYYIDGSGSDYIKSPTHADFGFGTDDFTIECWYRPVSKAQNYPRIWHFGPYWSNAASLAFQDRHNSYSTTFALSSFSLGLVLQSTTTVSNNTWYHLAVERSGSTITLYVNGTAEDTYDIGTSAFITSSSSYVSIGNVSDGSNLSEAEANGYISDFRYVKGTAVYDGDFTPPTKRLEATSNTKLLTCHLPYLKDGSSTDHSMTLTGNWSIESFAPYDYLGYDAETHGGSVYFDGSGDYLSIVDSTMTSTGEFTVECWFYASSAPGTILHWSDISDNLDNDLGILADGSIQCRIGSGGNTKTISSTGLWNTNTWHHIAAVRNSSNVVKIYLDGAEIIDHGTRTDDMDNTLEIGRNPYNGGVDYFGGYIADFRIVESAVYTADFTPPTEPLTAITNTSLLISGTDASIVDKSQSTILTLNGSTQSSTTVTKYGSSSMYFDGDSDYIVIDHDALGTGNWTIEGWVYFNVISSGQYIFDFRSGNTTNPALNIQTDWRYISTNSYLITSGVTPSANTWYHFALVKNNGTTTLYINGSSIGTYSDSLNYAGSSAGIIGRYYGGGTSTLNGYLEDFRVTKGLARYTADFTPPTASLKG